MPVTPLHLGPGTALKAVLGSRMSLTVFAFSQITMDLEVLARIALGAQQLHGFTNTVLGATAIGAHGFTRSSGLSDVVHDEIGFASLNIRAVPDDEC